MFGSDVCGARPSSVQTYVSSHPTVYGALGANLLISCRPQFRVMWRPTCLSSQRLKRRGSLVRHTGETFSCTIRRIFLAHAMVYSTFAGPCRGRCGPLFSVRVMCRCLRIQPSGFYAWLKHPLSKRAREDARQTELIHKAWRESGKVYGYRKLHDDLLDQGETCCPNRVARLATLAGIKAQIGYKRRPGSYGGKPSLVVDNTLDRQFDVDAPDTRSEEHTSELQSRENLVCRL